MFLTEEEVNKVIRTVRGITPEDAVLTYMKQYFRDEYSICILDYICSTERFGPPGRQSKRVQFVTWGIEETRKCPTAFDVGVRKNVKNVFARACQENDLHPDFHDPSNFFPVLSDIESDITELLFKKKRNQIDAVLKSYSQVRKQMYSTPCVHVFYETDEDIVKNEENGLSSEIMNKISDMLGEVEGFEGRRLGHAVFTSLQTLREKYDNNTYYYLL